MGTLTQTVRAGLEPKSMELTCPPLEVLIEYDPIAKAVTIPPQIGLWITQTLIWKVLGLPKGFSMKFAFPDFSDPAKGPFSHVDPPAATATDHMVTSERYWPYIEGRLRKLVNYRIEVCDDKGKSITLCPNPVIDTLGDPPPGPMEET